MKKILLSILLVFGFGLAVAQAQTISGRVTDADSKEGIPGASVFIKGTTTGTITDADGKYTLTATSGALVVYQILGYKTQEITVGGQTTLDIILAADAEALKEIVVVGYGTQEKRDVTGSIVSVKAEDIKNIPVPSFESAIQGRMTGVQVTSGSGKVGQGFSIRVRGSSSLTGSNEPLYVVDGIIVTSGGANQNDDNLNPLADIPTNDIESIDVLKDAAAAAIYGSRASNGVVIITTKKGKAGAGKINIGYSTGVGSATRKRGFLNRAEYIDLFSESLANVGYTPTEINDAFEGDLGLSSNWRNETTDVNWEDKAFQRSTVQQFDLNASGGNEKIRYYAGGSYTNQGGIMAGNRFERFSSRLSLDGKINDKVSVGGSFMLSRTKNFRAAGDNGFNNQLQLVAMPPLQEAYLADGVTTNLNTLYYNALTELTDAKNTAVSFRNLSTLYATYQIIPSLTFRSDLALDLLHLAEETYNGRRTQGNTQAPEGIGTYSTSLITNYTLTNTLAYNKTFNETHKVEALLGMSYQDTDENYSSLEGRIFPSDDFTKIASAADITAGSTSRTGSRFDSYFLRGNYKFKDKYLVSLSGRVDGSSRFGPSNRYGFFPAGSVGWIASEEEFIKNIDMISFLKVRMGYGVTGNGDIADFGYKGLYGSNAYLNQAGTLPSQAPNDNLKWETTYQFDSGLEIGLFKDRVSLSLDYYNKNTRDLLLNIPEPLTSGYASRLVNVGKMKNHGFEIALNTRNLVGDFKWNTSFNISFNRNKVVDLQGQRITPGNRNRTLNEAREGQPIGVLFGVKYAGVNPTNGDAIYYNASGDTTSVYNNALRQVIGDPNPKFTGGLTNTLSYKGFDLSIFAQFVYGNDIYNMAGGFMSANGDYWDNQTKDQLNRWKKPGDVTQVPQARFDEQNGTRISSRYVYDGSYLRLKTATLAYNLPKAWLTKVKIGSARIYITGQNLLTKVAKNFSGWDPELSSGFTQTSSQNANVIMGNDFYTPPQARTIIFGFNIGF